MSDVSESDRESDIEEMEEMENTEIPVLFESTEPENEIKSARLNALKKLQEDVLQNEDGAPSADRQLSYLMSQSEVFAHFLTDGDGDALAPPDKRKSKKKKSNVSGGLGGGAGRTRMSEEAEDRRLMKLAQSKGKDVSRVSEQPQTIAGTQQSEMRMTPLF
jgi:hypothetical protein